MARPINGGRHSPTSDIVIRGNRPLQNQARQVTCILIITPAEESDRYRRAEYISGCKPAVHSSGTSCQPWSGRLKRSSNHLLKIVWDSHSSLCEQTEKYVKTAITNVVCTLMIRVNLTLTICCSSKLLAWRSEAPETAKFFSLLC